MPLSADQEQLEHNLRVSQMQTNIEQMTTNIEKMRADIKQANRTFTIQIISALVAAVAAGAALGHYFIK